MRDRDPTTLRYTPIDRRRAISFCAIMASSFNPRWERKAGSMERSDVENEHKFFSPHYRIRTRVAYLVDAACRAVGWLHKSSSIWCPTCGHTVSEHARVMFAAEAECLLREGWKPGDEVFALTEIPRPFADSDHSSDPYE